MDKSKEKTWEEKILKEKRLLVTDPKKLTKNSELQKKIRGIQKDTGPAVKALQKLIKEGKVKTSLNARNLVAWSIQMIKGYLTLEKMSQRTPEQKHQDAMLSHDTKVIERQKQRMKDMGVKF